MTEQLPAVFISSTYFDLRQLRADLASFVLDTLGYRLLASEFPTFPIDPSVDTIENCRRRVEEADFFILVIGGRYGSKSPAGHSVTNSEYLVARQRGLPIYVFVLKEVFTLLRAWEANPNGDFSFAVDSSELFQFVKQVASADRVWISAFETAQDIIVCLRTQLAYQMKRGAAALALLSEVPPEFEGLSGRALRLAVEKPDGWVGHLFAFLLCAEFDRIRSLREMYDAGVALGAGERLDEKTVGPWASARLREVTRTAGDTKSLIHSTINRGLEARDPRGVLRAAEQIAAVYRGCLEWSAELRRAHVPDRWRSVVDPLSHLYDRVLTSLEQMPSQLEAEIERVIRSGIPQDIELTLHFDVTPSEEFQQALNSLLAESGE